MSQIQVTRIDIVTYVLRRGDLKLWMFEQFSYGGDALPAYGCSHRALLLVLHCKIQYITCTLVQFVS